MWGFEQPERQEGKTSLSEHTLDEIFIWEKTDKSIKKSFKELQVTYKQKQSFCI